MLANPHNLFKLNRSAAFSLMVVGLAWASGSGAAASCGDYLHKRGDAKPGEMAQMEHHGDSTSCEQRKGSLPLTPPPVYETSDSDELNAQFLIQFAGDDGATRRRHANLGATLVGVPERIDRPPQADLNDDLI